MLTEIVSTHTPEPKPAAAHVMNAALTPIELTAYPDAHPSIIDLPHAHQCPPCIEGFDADSFLDIDCPCAYVGLAPIAERSYSKVVAHCPMCGLDHADARDHDAERD